MDIRNPISAELFALLNRNAGILQSQSYTGSSLGFAGSETLGLSTNPNVSSFLASLILQQQAEERQRSLLIRQLALLGADSNGLSSFALPSQADTLALMLQQRQQLQNFPVENAPLDRLAALRATAASDSAAGLTSLPDQLNDLTKILHAQHRHEQHQPDAANITHKKTLTEIKRKGRSGSFPQKLHQILQELERQDGGAAIASFLHHGKAFAIHKPRDFVKTIMPKYFRMSRFSSFQRQLNLYDFQRITEGHGKGAYYHELFVQDKPILATMMKRNKIKGLKNGDDVSHEDEEEENDEAKKK